MLKYEPRIKDNELHDKESNSRNIYIYAVKYILNIYIHIYILNIYIPIYIYILYTI